MNCLLVSATEMEIAPFLETHRKPGGAAIAGATVDVLVTGVGMLSCAYRLQRQIAVTRPDLVLQVGVGGCFDGSVPLGSVLCVNEDAVADMGVMEHGELKTVFDMGLADRDIFPYENGWLKNKSDWPAKWNGAAPVRSVTVNQVTADTGLLGLYRQKFSPVLESMEGAALHYVCLMEGIEFLQVRSVSNYIGERDKKQWRMKEAIANLHDAVTRFMKTL